MMHVEVLPLKLNIPPYKEGKWHSGNYVCTAAWDINATNYGAMLRDLCGEGGYELRWGDENEDATMQVHIRIQDPEKANLFGAFVAKNKLSLLPDLSAFN